MMSVCSRRILCDLICVSAYPEGVNRRQQIKYEESTYAICQGMMPSSIPTVRTHIFALIPKKYLCSFLDLLL